MVFQISGAKWIKNCISGAWFSVIVNGESIGFFPSSQGIRQGDPLSPFLFILMADAFSRFITRSSQLGLWQGILIPRTSITVTHSLFADDTLLFGMSNVKEANHIKYSLDLYLEVSSQRINASKSKIFIFNTNDAVAQRISSTLGFPVDQLPSVYLGILFLWEQTR